MQSVIESRWLAVGRHSVKEWTFHSSNKDSLTEQVLMYKSQTVCAVRMLRISGAALWRSSAHCAPGSMCVKSVQVYNTKQQNFRAAAA